MPKIVELITSRSDRVTPATRLREVAAHMLATSVSSVIVVDTDRAVGIITERDILRLVQRRGSPEQRAGDAMSSPVHAVSADTDFRQAYREAARLGIRRIVVVAPDGQPLGIVNESDFRKHLGPDFFMHLNAVDTLMEQTFPRLPGDAGLDAAVNAMAAVRGSCAVVVDGSQALGVVTEHDVVRFFLNGEQNPPLARVMSRPAITIVNDRPLAEAARLMLTHGIRHLPVVDTAGQLVGLLSEHALMSPLKLDLLDRMINERQSIADSRDQLQGEAARQARYQRALLDNFPFPVWLKDTESRFLTANKAMADVAGLAVDTLIGKSDLDIWPAELADRYRTDDRMVMDSRRNRVITEPIVVDEHAVWHETYKAPVVDEDGELLGMVGFSQDISHRQRATDAMRLRNTALAALIGGQPLAEVLDLIARSFEAEMPGWRCAILLADDSGRHLHPGAAPSLPPGFSKAVDGMLIAPGVASSGAAAALRQRIIVGNVFEHPNWVDYRELAHQGDFSACWSEPVLGARGQLLGTFTAYYRTPARPHEDYLDLVTQGAQLTALVVEHQRNAQELNSSLSTFRGIFDSVGEALFILGADHRFLFANTSAEQLFGLPRDQLIGRSHDLFLLPGRCEPETVDRHIGLALAGTPQTLEALVRDAREQVFPVEVRLHDADYFGQPVLIASAVNIAERRNVALRLEIEHDLAQCLATDADREALLAALLKATLRFPELDAGGIYRRLADDSYGLFTERGLSPEFIDQARLFPADTAFAQLANQGQPVCMPATSEEAPEESTPLDPATLRAEGLRCLMQLPVRLGSRTELCLLLAGRQSSQVAPSTRQALEALGSYFGQTLQRLEHQEETRRLQQNLSGIFDTLADFIFVLDLDNHILHYNRAVAETLGYGTAALRSQPILAIHPENLRDIAERSLADVIAGRSVSCPLPMLRADGTEIQVETRIASGYWDGKPALIAIAQDISERLIAEERQRLAASVFDNAHEGIMITDPAGHIVEVNSTFTELTGYTRDEALGKTPDLLKSGHHEPAFYHEMWAKIAADGFWRGEVWNRKKTGEIFVEQLTISTVRNRRGAITHYVAIFTDITLIKQHQQRLEHLAHFDALTQLPNRMLLGDRLQQAKAQAERSGKMLAVCYLDLDNFKPINDEFGHAVGDYLLVDVAQRLKTSVRGGDTVARLGGDEFVLLIGNLGNLGECDHAMARVVNAIAQPFRVSQRQVNVSASIGVTLYPNDSADSDTLLRHADQAMYAAKQAGRNRYHLFDPENDRRARARRDELGRIRAGLAKGEFHLHYQPKVDMRKGVVIGAEALIRWQHPERGLLPPRDFLPAVEDSEAAIELGEWVINEALRQIDAWQRDHGLKLAVSINIAGNHLQHPGFSQRLGELLAHYPAVSPHQIELEVLETAALEDVGTTAALFAECRNLGVSFALDDFGTGYSSLTYFRRLPADLLKIDQSFVRDMLDNPDDLAIVEGVIGLTQAFRRAVIAEGVETVEHGLVLLLLGCDMAQGYGIARPMPPEALPDWIANFQPDELWNLATAFNWSRDDLPMLIAEVDHKRWMRALHASLDDASGSTEPPPLDPHACRFSHWLDSADSRRYVGIPASHEIHGLHARVHDIGRRLVAQHQADDQASVATLREELRQTSEQLAAAIQTIQTETLIGAQRIRR